MELHCELHFVDGTRDSGRRAVLGADRYASRAGDAEGGLVSRGLVSRFPRHEDAKGAATRRPHAAAQVQFLRKS